LMSEEDFTTAKKWNEEGYVKFGRVVFDDANRASSLHHHLTHWCELSEAVWEDVIRLRRERAERGLQNRTYKRTEEKQT